MGKLRRHKVMHVKTNACNACSTTNRSLALRWADLEDTWRLRHWPGFLFFEEGLPQALQNDGKKPSRSNCLHLEDMYSNSVYRGVFPFFSGRYRRFVERTLEACGLASVTLPNDFGDSLHTQIS